jgi:hypothetical protein
MLRHRSYTKMGFRGLLSATPCLHGAYKGRTTIRSGEGYARQTYQTGGLLSSRRFMGAHRLVREVPININQAKHHLLSAAATAVQ